MARLRFSSREMMLLVALMATVLGLWPHSLRRSPFLESFDVRLLVHQVAFDRGWTELPPQAHLSGTMNSVGAAGNKLTRHRVGKVFAYRCAGVADSSGAPITSLDWSQPLLAAVITQLEQTNCSIDYHSSAGDEMRISYHHGKTQGEIAMFLVDDKKGRVALSVAVYEFKR